MRAFDQGPCGVVATPGRWSHVRVVPCSPRQALPAGSRRHCLSRCGAWSAVLARWPSSGVHLLSLPRLVRVGVGLSASLWLRLGRKQHRIQTVNCRLARCLLSACGFPYNWKAPTCCSLSASDVEVTQARSLPPCCDASTGTRTRHRKHAAHGLGLLFHSLRAFPLNAIKRNQAVT